MQTTLATSLRREFAAALRRLLPSFAEDKNVELPCGWRAYRCVADRKFTSFVILCISPREDRFTVEVAWSLTGQLPCSEILQAPGTEKTGESLRLSLLWHPQQVDHWWTIGKQRTLEDLANFAPDEPVAEKLRDVEAKVAEAMAKLQAFGIPYLKRIADRLAASAQCFESAVPRAKR